MPLDMDFFLTDLQLFIMAAPLVWYGFVFVLGAIVGSFLNVYIYRFHTGKSLSGHSHCLSCAARLRAYDLFPLLSYLALRGRCRKCGAYIPSRYFWVELITGLSFVGVVFYLPFALWVFGAILCAVLVVVAVYDLYHMVIPNEFVWSLLVLACGHVVYRYIEERNIGIVGDSLGGALLAFCFFAGLWWYSKGRWIGFGDAKLAIPFGLMVGVSGAFSVVVFSFWIGTIISLVLIAYTQVRRRGQKSLRFMSQPLTIQSEVPFAPFFILGFLTVFLGGVDVLSFFTYVW